MSGIKCIAVWNIIIINFSPKVSFQVAPKTGKSCPLNRFDWPLGQVCSGFIFSHFCNICFVLHIKVFRINFLAAFLSFELKDIRDSKKNPSLLLFVCLFVYFKDL